MGTFTVNLTCDTDMHNQIYLDALQHASYCTRDKCDNSRCQPFKKMTEHALSCPQQDDCNVCKQFMTLCCQHAKQCNIGSECRVPYCARIKQRLLQKENNSDVAVQDLTGQMELMFHASKCEDSNTCGVPECATVRQITAHAAVCNVINCRVPYCEKVKQLAAHYRDCKRPSCRVCGVVKLAKQRSVDRNTVQNEPTIVFINSADIR